MKTKKISNFVKHLFLIIVCFTYIFPFYWIVNISLQSPISGLSYPPSFFKGIVDPNFNGYLRVFNKIDVLGALFNSLSAVFISLAIIIPISIFGAYSISRYRYKGRKTILLSVLSMRMIPPIVFSVPFFLLMNRYNLIDTRLGLGLAYAAINFPMVVWLLSGYLNSVPVEIEEAARIDGCSLMGIIGRIIIPIISPGIAAVSIIAAMMGWTDYLLASVLTRSKAATMPLAIQMFLHEAAFDYQQMSSYAVLTILPAIIIGAFAMRYLIKGLTMGAIK